MRKELQEARKMCADWEKGPVDLSIVERRILIPLPEKKHLRNQVLFSMMFACGK
ncbi:MAG: hypothetical protein IKF64_04410 [Eubacterium sp.]|nr:hypothetical protein [Eubacterium sp.]